VGAGGSPGAGTARDGAVIWSWGVPLLWTWLGVYLAAAAASRLGWAPEITAVLIGSWNLLLASMALLREWPVMPFAIGMMGLQIWQAGQAEALAAGQCVPRRALRPAGRALAGWARGAARHARRAARGLARREA
jgi:hypothetical protein